MIEHVYCELSVIFAEPDSKWPLYTRAMIMRSLDSEVKGLYVEWPESSLTWINIVAGILPGHPGYPDQVGGGGPHEARLLSGPQGQDHYREHPGEGVSER